MMNQYENLQKVSAPAERRPNPERVAHLADQLRTLPDEAFTRLQIIQGEVGCLHGCAFCSAQASTHRTRIAPDAMTDLILATRQVALEIAQRDPDAARPQHGLVGGNREKNPGVIYPYTDSDPLSDPNLEGIIGGVSRELGCRFKISSVGYDRTDGSLQQMHERIAQEHAGAFEGLRLSMSQYPIGARDPESFTEDFANALRTYRPVMDHLRQSEKEAVVELRFAPHFQAGDEPLGDTRINGHHVLHSGPYTLVSHAAGEELASSHVQGVDGRSPVFSEPATSYTLITASDAKLDEQWQELAQQAIEAGGNLPSSPDARVHTKDVDVYLTENVAGPYYSIDPAFSEDGHFEALQLYPQTEQRPIAGYIDSTRYVLNTLLDYKKAHGVGRREPMPGATWDDVEEVLRLLEEQMDDLTLYNAPAATHMKTNIMPIVQMYVDALSQADYDPALVFDNRFTIDTGTIVNQGRAKHLFGGLATATNLPLTPQEQRSHGSGVSLGAMRGDRWKWSPNPATAVPGEEAWVTIGGAKSPPITYATELRVDEVSYETLESLRSFIITGL